MPRLALLAGLLVAAGLAAAGCDFAPALDIPTPAFDNGITVNAVLFADSTVVVRVTRARDPYAQQTGGSYAFATVADAMLTLARDGGPTETLRYVPQPCQTGYDPRTQQPTVGECGVYVSAVPVAAGGAYTLRAEAPGQPAAEARVRVPLRPPVVGTVEPGPTRENLATDRVTLRITDAPGAGQWYGIDVTQTFEYVSNQPVCTPTGCRDSTYTVRYTGQNSFATSDAVLLAALRGLPGTATFVTFSDALFDGQTRAFTLDALRYTTVPSDGSVRRTARLIAFDRPLVAAYEQAYFSLGEGNPFQEPQDPVSNVAGGYGLVGAAAITEVPLPPR